MYILKPIRAVMAFSALLTLSLFASAEQVCTDSRAQTNPIHQYSFNSRGSAFDLETNLEWMRCSIGQVWDGIMCTGEPEKMFWDEAMDFASQLNFAGHSDWRLPSISELESILEKTCHKPAINLNVFPGTPSDYFLTGIPVRGAHNSHWKIGFTYGYNRQMGPANIPAYVRLVRNID